MFRIGKQGKGARGAFVKLVELDSDDFAVIVRYPSDARLHHVYIGPDFAKAEEIFDNETSKVAADDDSQ